MPDEKMPAETLKALKGSIAKWEEIVAGTGEDRGPLNCPLCMLFNPVGDVDFLRNDNACAGCPVVASTGKRFCGGTPYEDYAELEDEVDTDDEHDQVRLKAAAQAELDFLRSLLPEGERR